MRRVLAQGAARPPRSRPPVANAPALNTSVLVAAGSGPGTVIAAPMVYNAQDLIEELYASLADHSTTRLLKRLAAYDALVIDELGYMNLKPEHANALFQLLEQRYARKSTVITTNLDFDQWYDLFRNKPLVDALLDRLQHHCITLRLTGTSLRAPAAPAASPTPR